ncbi:MAG: hypothetical protein JKY60_14695 [Kordiimonadaceae bacterium]|nr:hypothetical protein [Kordiimonadaceae bacterium]
MLSSLRVLADSKILREPPRPVALRQKGYDDAFDFRTVFYDVFYMADKKTVRLIGPPLFNFADYLNEESFTCSKGNAPVKAESHLHRAVTYVDLQFAEDVETLFLDAGNLGRFQLPVRENQADFFEGERVVLTMIKFDPLVWVKDWAEFYVRHHGATAIVIYNNQALDYTSTEIEEALSQVEGLNKYAVIDWAFPYGPQAGASGLWDSAYCQAGALEHARWFYLQRARSVLNHDIDELVVCQNDVSIFEEIERSSTGYLWYSSVWTSKPLAHEEAPPALERRHKHYWYYGNLFFAKKPPWESPGGGKWGAVPQKCPLDAQWQVHEIVNMACDKTLSAPIFFRHFRDMNTQWKVKRDAAMKGYHVDNDLLAAYKKIGW